MLERSAPGRVCGQQSRCKMSDPTHPERLELVEEQAKVTRTEVERGRVVVRTRVEERDELVEVALRRDHVAVEHVPIGIVVETAPAVREEDGVLIVPVVEEQLVVRTQLVR